MAWLFVNWLEGAGSSPATHPEDCGALPGDIAEAVEDGLLVSGGNGPENPTLGGLRAAGFIVNCPIMALR